MSPAHSRTASHREDAVKFLFPSASCAGRASIGHARQVCTCIDVDALLQEQKHEKERQHIAKGQQDPLGMCAAATDQDSATALGTALYQPEPRLLP